CHSRDRTTNKIHCVYFIAERQSPIQRPFVIPAFLFVIPAKAGIQTMIIIGERLNCRADVRNDGKPFRHAIGQIKRISRYVIPTFFPSYP
ncbi:MAG: hypothetical protein LBB59_00850, partial [Campylobacteraceae bacterium]|nr:hypothetical protein [Campylobacteraceae bacterium]